MMSSGYSWTSTIPASLADGEYLVRHEIMSLHEIMQDLKVSLTASSTATSDTSL